MNYIGRFVYTQPRPSKGPDQDLTDADADVIVEGHADCVGITIPMDGAELRYFSRNEVRMLASTLLAMIDNGED